MQIEFDLPLGILRFDHPLATDRLSELRMAGNRLDDARQNARVCHRCGISLMFRSLEEGWSRIRRRGKQVPWRKVMSGAWSAGFLLDRKELLLTLHLNNGCKLEKTLIWALAGELPAKPRLAAQAFICDISQPILR